MSYVQTDSVSVNDQQALLFAYALDLLIELIIGTWPGNCPPQSDGEGHGNHD